MLQIVFCWPLLDFLARVICGPLLPGNCSVSILTFRAEEIEGGFVICLSTMQD